MRDFAKNIVDKDAQVCDIARAQRMKDLKNQFRIFGVGQHFCIGSRQARKELTAMFDEILPRIRNPRLKSAPHNLVCNFIPGIKEMHISFDKKAI